MALNEIFLTLKYGPTAASLTSSDFRISFYSALFRTKVADKVILSEAGEERQRLETRAFLTLEIHPDEINHLTTAAYNGQSGDENFAEIQAFIDAPFKYISATAGDLPLRDLSTLALDTRFDGANTERLILAREAALTDEDGETREATLYLKCAEEEL